VPADLGCVLPKSQAVIGWCYAGIAATAVALVAGLVYATALHSAAAAQPRTGLLNTRGPARLEISP